MAKKEKDTKKKVSSAKKKSPKMPNLNTLQARRAIYIAGVVIFVFLVWFKAKPAYDSVKTLETQTTESVAAKQKQENDLEVLEKRLDKGGKDLSRIIVTALPVQVRTDLEFERFNRLAAATQTNLTSFTPGAVADSGSYQKVSLSLATTCSYENCLRFLGGLHNMTRLRGKEDLVSVGPIIGVDNVNFAPGTGDSITMTITANIFLSPNKDAAPAPGAAPTTPPVEGAPAE
jgi:Tfp pilus assembly protein PilO